MRAGIFYTFACLYTCFVWIVSGSVGLLLPGTAHKRRCHSAARTGTRMAVASSVADLALGLMLLLVNACAWC